MLEKNEVGLPQSEQLGNLLDLSWGAGVDEVVDSFLLSPLRDFLKRPGKKIRGQMVEVGFELATGKEGHQRTESENRQLLLASDLLEALHAASLIIDDIQDNSELRRGEPTVHKKHGMPLALNAGNWLYFWPLQNVETWDIPTEKKLSVFRICHRGLLRAHFGQALDVGLDIFKVPQNKIRSTCLASLELKSGALMAMALSLGAVLGGASHELEQLCDRFGHAFGIALQMFDDAGNASVSGVKQFEDLKLKRPSWLVAVAASELTENEFKEFEKTVLLFPDSEPLKLFLEQNQLVSVARNEAKKYLNDALLLLEREKGVERPQSIKRIQEMAELLVRAYV
jgi:geranylgeranyl pyrophosphate synthase